MREITLRIDSDGVTCRGCGLRSYTIADVWRCAIAKELGADDDRLQEDKDGNPLCLPECARGGVKREEAA